MRIDFRERTPTQRAVQRKYRMHRVLLDGEDVTKGCFLVDDQTGEVGRYLTDATGHHYLLPDRSGAAREFLRGTVILVPPEAVTI